MPFLKSYDEVNAASGSRTLYSPGYRQLLKDEEYYDWYDVRPYALGVWPHIFARRLRSGKWRIDRVKYIGLAVEMVLEGEIIYETADRSFSVGPGEVFVTHSLESVTLRNGNCHRSRQLQLIYSGAFSCQAGEALQLGGVRKLSGDLTVLRGLMEHCGALMRRREAGDAAENALTGYKVLLFLAEYGIEQLKNRDFPPPLTRAVRLLNSANGNMPVNELAERLGMSRSNLDRLFRRYCGLSPQKYRNRVRMESARQLVGGTRLSFKEISDRLGFAAPAHFSEAFHESVGCTLKEYRKRAAEKRSREEGVG